MMIPIHVTLPDEIAALIKAATEAAQEFALKLKKNRAIDEAYEKTHLDRHKMGQEIDVAGEIQKGLSERVHRNVKTRYELQNEPKGES